MYVGQYILWLHSRASGALAAAPDGILYGSLIAALLGVCIVGWIRFSRQTRALRIANEQLKRDLAEVAEALENEMKWRFATEAFNDQIAAAANDLAAKSTRELQQLLSAESFNPGSDRIEQQREAPPLDATSTDRS
jgi:hypothetical protein